MALVTHVRNDHATADSRADISMPAIDHDVHAVAAPALAGVTDKRDIPSALRHDHALASQRIQGDHLNQRRQKGNRRMVTGANTPLTVDLTGYNVAISAGANGIG